MNETKTVATATTALDGIPMKQYQQYSMQRRQQQRLHQSLAHHDCQRTSSWLSFNTTSNITNTTTADIRETKSKTRRVMFMQFLLMFGFVLVFSSIPTTHTFVLTPLPSKNLKLLTVRPTSSSPWLEFLSPPFNKHPTRFAPLCSFVSITTRRRRRPRLLSLCSTTGPDRDLEDIFGEEEGEETSSSGLAVSAEPFVSEADIAEQANALAAVQATSSSVVDLSTELKQSFLQYALSIILGRALPDMRDGLKPVHRRILYSMHQLQLFPKGGHRKCARVVGDVLGKYHPHGDMSVYDALVRMAQDFSTLYRLVDGHGNFGSVDNDPAAAMRYTECKLTPLAQSTLLDELTYDTVDFLPNFDGTEQEPNVLPSKLPLLLLNGSSGIAVGMATNIPPHNLREVLRACTGIIRRERMTQQPTSNNKSVSERELLSMIPGPDFPTGASIMGTQDAAKLYKTSNGGVVMRAVTHVEQIGRRSAIIVTELPYQVNKAALLEQIASLVNDKKLEGIADLRDESDRQGIRVVLELKQRDAGVPQVVLANLYQKTKLQTVFSGNLVALMKPSETNNKNDKNQHPSSSSSTIVSLTPQRFTLRQYLDYFLDFRFETIRRKTKYQLGKVQTRAHTVEGLLKALANVDQIIELIRTLPDTAACRQALMATKENDDDSAATTSTATPKLTLGLSREQADSVLRLQLGQLTRLNLNKLQEEQTELDNQRGALQTLLDNNDAVYQLMLKEFEELDQKFGHERKTKILNDEGEVQEIDLIRNARSVIVVTRGGYIKRMPLKTFDSQGRGTRGKRGTTSDAVADEVRHCITCNDHDTLLMITQNGVAFGLLAYQVPSASRTAKGTPLQSVLPIAMNDVVTTVLPVSEFSSEEYIVLATKRGWIKRTSLDAFEKISSRGLTIATLSKGDKLTWCRKCTVEDDLLIGSSNGMAARFPVASLRPTGRTSRGIISMKLKEGDTIADMNVLAGAAAAAETVNGDDKETVNGDAASKSSKELLVEEYVLCVTEQGFGKRVPTSEFRSTSRAKVGVIAMKFKKSRGGKEDRMSCFTTVKADDEILVNTAKGIMVRQRVANIPSQSRTATGVLVQKVDESDSITSVSVVPTQDDIEEEI